ncbi:hypothetical protein OIE69_40410 [Actinacidiphila glaucinigra]|uniref:hypothetical protein n=1 Tax=Actinacidiphila glaucinigra TaxID=235986 RepID=UPI002DDAD0A8|nr:hypothetical protein [Actinacidiphila glaucinigra]WSD65716.1 hypothetical protein OIE69_40410 [Actinacidiphila glaucinigra]
MSLSHVLLSSGRSIELTELRMSSTYGGMLEGYPCKRINDIPDVRQVYGLRPLIEGAGTKHR